MVLKFEPGIATLDCVRQIERHCAKAHSRFASPTASAPSYCRVRCALRPRWLVAMKAMPVAPEMMAMKTTAATRVLPRGRNDGWSMGRLLVVGEAETVRDR